jgi:hypothetical protein
MRRIGLIALWAWMIVGVVPGRAQVGPNLDNLQNCLFTDAAPSDDMVIGAVVYNLRTGTGCAENLDEVFPVASVPKLFVAGAMFEWILENEAIDFNTELTFGERYWMGGRGDCLGASTLNQRVTIGEMGDVMIACSDNAATWMLMDAMGWDTVQSYIDGLGIEGIGPVIPYSEVDRQKLIFLNENWENVPIAMASRFYRSDMTTGLDTYFDEVPIYSRSEEIEANALYFENSDFNTLTPRAMAEYLIKLTNDSPLDTNDGQIARWVFNTMLLTERQFTGQAFPGTISVGAKNGWDVGLRAEVNVLFDDLLDQTRIPVGFTIVFARQTDFESPELQQPTRSENGALNQYLLTLSPVMNSLMFPGYTPPTETVFSRNLSSAAVNPKLVMDSCWRPYAESGFAFNRRGQLESCWLNQPQSRIAPGDDIGVGLILDNLNEEDTRLAFVFRDPNGIQRSYQTQLFFQEAVALYYWHPVPTGAVGTWTVEVYINRSLVLRREVEVTSLF